jgi:hypothetical protein
MCPIPNGFRDRAIPLYSSKIVDKKEILRTVFHTGIYYSSDKVGTAFLVQYISENSIVNINALCNICENKIQHISIRGVFKKYQTLFFHA